MQTLVEGIHHFQQNVFPSKLRLFKRLAKGQQPLALFITCSDSRINPNLITQTEPGELFILRNAGNIVPPHGTAGGEAATIEFAIVGLGIKDIIVCGHSLCGAMKALFSPEEIRQTMPTVSAWLGHAEATRRIVAAKYGRQQQSELVNLAIQENVLVQVENLRTHPVVAAGLARRELTLHAWIYTIETGQIRAYDFSSGQFHVLTGTSSGPLLKKRRATAVG